MVLDRPQIDKQLTRKQNPMLYFADMGDSHLFPLLEAYGLDPTLTADDEPVPGSHWGDPEAGLIGNRLYFRNDTPLHSILHEACHYICMPPDRRLNLHTDAGGDDVEESAVCYLQLLLADQLPGIGRDRLAKDMDAWGYSYRLGNTMDWFHRDAEDAVAWLQRRGLIDTAGSLQRPGSCSRTG